MLRFAVSRMPLRATAACGHAQTCPRALFSATARCLQSGGSGAGESAAEREDREELERERRLREQFAQKIQGQHQPPPFQWQGMGGSCGPGRSCATGEPSSSQQAQLHRMARFLFFMTALIMIMGLSQMTNPNAPWRLLQSIPWWELPLSTASYYLLMRALLPSRQQQAIKEEYQAASREQPLLTFDQFMIMRYPHIFDGYRGTQNELVAATAACLATARDLKFGNTISRAAGSARDVKASVDRIMDALRRDYPDIFAAH